MLAGQLRLPEGLQQLEKAVIETALRRNGGNRRRTAGELGVSRQVLQYKMKKHGLA
jgi:transcriptional regulator with PAS, ATPase and Fis domain